MAELHFVGVNPIIVNEITTGFEANVEMEASAGRVTRFYAVRKKIRMLYFTGGELVQTVMLNALTAILTMIVYCIIGVVMGNHVRRKVKFFVAAKALLPWLSYKRL